MLTKSAKAKSRRVAQKIREDLIHSFALDPSDIRVTPASVNGPDLQMSKAASDVFPFDIEVKAIEKIRIWESLKQAERNRLEGQSLLVFKRNRGKLYACLDWNVFLKLARSGSNA